MLQSPNPFGPRKIYKSSSVSKSTGTPIWNQKRNVSKGGSYPRAHGLIGGYGFDERKKCYWGQIPESKMLLGLENATWICFHTPRPKGSADFWNKSKSKDAPFSRWSESDHRGTSSVFPKAAEPFWNQNAKANFWFSADGVTLTTAGYLRGFLRWLILFKEIEKQGFGFLPMAWRWLPRELF